MLLKSISEDLEVHDTDEKLVAEEQVQVFPVFLCELHQEIKFLAFGCLKALFLKTRDVLEE